MIPESLFEEVKKRLQARRAVTDEGGRERARIGSVRCAGCGSWLVVVRAATGLRYYRCSRAMKGDVRDARPAELWCGCRTGHLPF